MVISIYYWTMIWRWGVDTIYGGDPNKGIGAVL